MRLIDADALKARLRGCMILMPNGEKCTAERAIDTQGTIEPEVRHGQWVMNNPYGIKCCSECGYGQRIGAENYCPNCGAKMSSDETKK